MSNLRNMSHFYLLNFLPFFFNSIGMLRHIRDFFQVIFKFDKLKTDGDSDLKTGGDKLLLTCVGVGFTNLSKATL